MKTNLLNTAFWMAAFALPVFFGQWGISELKANPMSVYDAHEIGEQRISIIASATGYYPKRVFAKKDVPLRIYLTGTGTAESCFVVHLGKFAQVPMSPGRAPAEVGSVRRTLRLGKIEEVTFIPRKAGNYQFGCPIQGFQGTITVRE